MCRLSMLYRRGIMRERSTSKTAISSGERFCSASWLIFVVWRRLELCDVINCGLKMVLRSCATKGTCEAAPKNVVPNAGDLSLLRIRAVCALAREWEISTPSLFFFWRLNQYFRYYCKFLIQFYGFAAISFTHRRLESSCDHCPLPTRGILDFAAIYLWTR